MVDKIQTAAVLLWEQCHMKDTAKATQANKISTVKCKRNVPKFEQQQVLQGDGLKKKWECGKCAGKKQKESKDFSFHICAHITSVVYTSSPEPPVDPCTLTHQPVLMYQGEQGPPFHSWIKDTISLAHQLDIPISMENVHGIDTGLQIHGPSFLLSAIPSLPPLSFSNAFVSSSAVTLDSLPPLTS